MGAARWQNAAAARCAALMMPATRVRVRMEIAGRVQGVGYRAFARDAASDLGLVGFVRNDPSGSVTLIAEGARPVLETLLSECRAGPRFGSVTHVETHWSDASGEFTTFEVRY